MGSGKAGWLTFLTNLSVHLVGTTPSVEILETWSTPLVDLSVLFAEIADDFQLTTYFEKRNTWGLMVKDAFF
jgi:hypothetical protein